MAYLFLDHEISAIDGREPASEVDDGGEFVDAVLAGVAGVADLDEGDVQVIRFRVDVLQLVQHFLALGAIVLVWKPSEMRQLGWKHLNSL